ncbi:hypothetical protein LX36DRAFT_244876 [Colletotrichum falcatum]|nr:hypothetical protein LX36DRAFT_244876 [Colletotrichum falcatum]
MVITGVVQERETERGGAGRSWFAQPRQLFWGDRLGQNILLYIICLGICVCASEYSSSFFRMLVWKRHGAEFNCRLVY